MLARSSDVTPAKVCAAPALSRQRFARSLFWTSPELGKALSTASRIRITEAIKPILDGIAARCREEGAGFVYVRFGGPFRIRYHGELEHWVNSRVRRADIRCVAIDVGEERSLAEGSEDEQDTYNPKQVTPGLIDPFAHFRAWKAADQARKEYKVYRAEKIMALVSECQSRGQTYSQIAAYLNSQEIYSMTGKPWTTEGLRKFFKRTGGK